MSSPSRSRPRFPARRRPENTLPSNEHHFTHTGYDCADNRQNVEELDGTRVTWTYDKKYQLLTENRENADPWSSYRTTYTYDPVGNRLTKDSTAAFITLTTYVYDAANELNTETTTVLGGGATVTTYTYDKNGSRIKKEPDGGADTDYDYDAQNRVIVVDSGVAVSFDYNAADQRVKKTYQADTTKYIFDYKKLLQETDGADATTALYTSTLRDEYGDLVSQFRDGDSGAKSGFFQYDALGATNELTTDAATVANQYKYDGWGNAVLSDVDNDYPTPYTWIGMQGYYKDPELANDYFTGERLYASDTGQFTRVDPIGLDGGDPNQYRYVANNPINATDPSGLQEVIGYSSPNKETPKYKVRRGTSHKIGPGRWVYYAKVNGVYKTTKKIEQFWTPYEMRSKEQERGLLREGLRMTGPRRPDESPPEHWDRTARDMENIRTRAKKEGIWWKGVNFSPQYLKDMPESQLKALGLVKGEFKLQGELAMNVAKGVNFLSPHIDIFEYKRDIAEGRTGAEAIERQKGDIAFNLSVSLVGGVFLGKALKKLARLKKAKNAATSTRAEQLISAEIKKVQKEMVEAIEEGASDVSKEGLEQLQKHVDDLRKQATKAVNPKAAKALNAIADEAEKIASRAAANVAEATSRIRAERLLGRKLTKSADEGVDWVDNLGNTYDQMGDPATIPNWAKQRANFFSQIDRHLIKADFTVIDLTDFPQNIKNEVSEYLLKKIPEWDFDRVITMGF